MPAPEVSSFFFEYVYSIVGLKLSSKRTLSLRGIID